MHNKDLRCKRNSQSDSHRYDDMLDLPHWEPARHPRMSAANRAAQFSPFDALTGYSDIVQESGRLTDRQIKLEEDAQVMLDILFKRLQNSPEQRPLVTVTYFEPDLYKEGGAYRTVTGQFKRIDSVARQLVLYAENQISDGQVIEIAKILQLELIAPK